ncbi:MAG: hypothetical protein JRF65_15080, partial [Deltaproteobacteria bacterium]|nr:hypothetical protein [Deltaproteobacteria bacterium]
MTRPTQPSGNADSGKEKSAASWSPYAAGFGLGVTLLLSYWFLGAGLGASGAFARLTA